MSKVKVFTAADAIYGDYVVCNNCNSVMLVECGEDECPVCHKIGCMSWADDEQERLVSDVVSYNEMED